MEPVKLPNPVEMERVIRAAGWLYNGNQMWRKVVGGRVLPFTMLLDEAYLFERRP